MEYHSAVRKNAIMPYVATKMNPEIKKKKECEPGTS